MQDDIKKSFKENYRSNKMAYEKKIRDVDDAMKFKRDTIQDMQKRKNDAIQIAGLQRDATLLTSARLGNDKRNIVWTREDIEKEWQYWHDFLQAKLDKQILGF